VGVPMIRIVEVLPEDMNTLVPWPPPELVWAEPVAATELVGALDACCAHAAAVDRNNVMNALNVSFMCGSSIRGRVVDLPRDHHSNPLRELKFATAS
jgi:hypothetical protein